MFISFPSPYVVGSAAFRESGAGQDPSGLLEQGESVAQELLLQGLPVIGEPFEVGKQNPASIGGG